MIVDLIIRYLSLELKLTSKKRAHIKVTIMGTMITARIKIIERLKKIAAGVLKMGEGHPGVRILPGRIMRKLISLCL